MSAAADLRAPSVHLNGTPGQRLVEAYVDAAYAVTQALEQIADAAPNARDYYVQGPDAFGEAAKQHESRCALLRQVRDELESLAHSVQAQIDERTSRRSR